MQISLFSSRMADPVEDEMSELMFPSVYEKTIPPLMAEKIQNMRSVSVDGSTSPYPNVEMVTTAQ